MQSMYMCLVITMCILNTPLNAKAMANDNTFKCTVDGLDVLLKL